MMILPETHQSVDLDPFTFVDFTSEYRFTEESQMGSEKIARPTKEEKIRPRKIPFL
jgi:hypothetical protein